MSFAAFFPALLLTACTHLSEQDLSDRMDLDGDGTPRPEDCDDDDSTVTLFTWYLDADADGYGGETTEEACTPPAGFVAEAGDCDDADASVNPVADEACNGRDDDCDGELDEGLELQTWYLDVDGDGYGGTAITAEACGPPSNYVDNADDCDDADRDIHPDAVERCDPDDVDEDCDGLSDDDDPTVDESTLVTVYQDEDGDGFGIDGTTSAACDPGDGWALEAGDCDDGDVERSPDTLWYRDVDEDGYGNPLYAVRSCLDVEGYVTNGLDCADSDPTLNPDAQEVCDELDIDEDCDGMSDDDDGSVAGQLIIYEDVDGDGYGDDATETQACDLWSGWVLAGGDCELADPDYSPGTVEICDDAIDQDCDAYIDCDDVNCSHDAACGFYDIASNDGRWVGDAGDYVGFGGLAWAGDVTGDGTQDILVGAPWADGYTGVVYLIDGASAGSGDLSSLALVALFGEIGGDFAGSSVAGLGDFDGDGYGDFVVGARGSDLHSGNTGALYLLQGPVSASTSLGDATAILAGADNGVSMDGAEWGAALDGGLDVTGNGVPDLVVGGQYSSGAYVVDPSTLGSEQLLSDVGYGFTYSGFTWLGQKVALCTDTGGDGAADVVLGNIQISTSPFLIEGPITAGGDIYAVSSASFERPSGTHHFPSDISCQGDVDGDGNSDILLGASDDNYMGSGAGAAYLYTGPYSGHMRSTSWAAMLLAESAGDSAGAAVSLDADFDRDGFSDLVVAAKYAEGHFGGSGLLYVFYGPLSGTLSLSSADAFVSGAAAGDSLGESLAGGSDLDGDRVDDLLIGASGFDVGTYSSEGAAYLLLGSRF